MDTNRVSSKDKIWFLVIGVILVLGLVFGIMTMLGGNSMPDDGVTDVEVLEITKESYEKIVTAQLLFSESIQGNWYATQDFFSKDSKELLEVLLETFKNFSDTLNSYDEELISNDIAQENFIILRDAINDDIPSYTKLIELYDLFYTYVNNNYRKTDAETIIALGDDRIVSAINQIDAAVSDLDNYDESAVVANIFQVALGKNYPSIYYYEPIEYIMGGLSDEQ